MTDHDETWQQRIQALYANVEELYAHVDVTVTLVDRDLRSSSSDGRRAAPLMPPLADVARRVLDTGMSQRDVALDQTGRQRVHGFPLRDGDSIVGVACVVEDDGARRELFVRCAMAIFDGYRRDEAALLERERQALEEAKRAHRQRDQFLAVVAHELRSPMTTILLWEQVLRNPALDEGTRTAALDAIHESAAGQALLVGDLLDVSAAINGKLHLDRQPTSILRVLTMAMEDMRPEARARQLELVAELDPDLGDVLGDSRRLRQIFNNLLSNAIKWTEQGHVSVRAYQSDDTITIDVRDTGRGIPADFIHCVFEPFSQVDDGKSGAGLGLGLAIARQLVELHGGTVSASSEGLGRGAQFKVVLPRMLTSTRDASRPPASIEGLRVLIVDDDARVVEALEILLGRAGAVVATATSAAAAYSMLRDGRTDIVLSDLGMTGEDGYSLARRLRALPGANRRIPAIAITARVDDQSRERALAAGFDRYLTKPIDLNLLVSTIAEIVQR
jgi:signal transduction histidine kinase